MLVRENSYIRFEFEAPILNVIILRNSTPSDEDWSYALNTLLSFYAAAEQSRQRFAVKIDLCKMAMLPLKRWRELADTLYKVRDRTNKCVYGTSLVNEGSMVRVAINGLLTLYIPVRPMRFMSSHAEAAAWLAKLICAEDLKPNPLQEPSEGAEAGTATEAPSTA